MDSAARKQITERKISERKKFLNKIMAFVIEIVKESGIETYRYQGSCNANVKSELRDLNKFSFFLDTGQTAMGGNSVEIKYRDKLVLDVYSQSFFPDADDSDFRVNVFDQDIGWQTEISKLIRNKARVIARKVAKKKKTEEYIAKVNEARLNEQRILNEAKRLKIY